MKKVLLFVVLLSSLYAFNQGSTEYGSGLKVNLKEDGSKYIRFIAWNQVWFRATDMNPGSQVGDTPSSFNADIGMRRLRFLALAQISPRYKIITHIGINNQTFLNGGAAGSGGTGAYGAGKKPGLFFHDAWNEFVIIQPKEGRKFSLHGGGGLHYFMGLSRMTMGSTLNFMAIDAPIFNWPLVDASDQFARQMGGFIYGKYDRFEYRMSVNKPFLTNLTPAVATNQAEAKAVDNNGNGSFSLAGYYEYQFFDKESNALPFKVGTYLGTKKMLNIGTGFFYAPNSTKSNVAGQIQEHDIRLLSADIFLDLPIGKPERKMAVTAYAVFYNFNFGPNYIRNFGIMNVGSANPNFTGQTALAGFGNAQATIGTGNIFYTQIGVLLPTQNEKPKVRIQPFGAYTYKNLDGLDRANSSFDIGANFFVDGHHAKITPQFSTRPVYTNSSTYSLKGELLIQLQVFL